MGSIVWMILLLYEVESMFYMNELKEKVKFDKLLILEGVSCVSRFMCKSLHVSVAFVLIPVLLDLEPFLVFEFVLLDFFMDFFLGFGLEVSLVKVQYLELSFHEFHFDRMTHELLHFLQGQLFFQDLELLKPVVVRGVKHGFLELN